MNSRALRRHVPLSREVRSLLEPAVLTGALTARGHDRILRLARTIADLDGQAGVAANHVEEALSYRLGARVSTAAA